MKRLGERQAVKMASDVNLKIHGQPFTIDYPAFRLNVYLNRDVRTNGISIDGVCHL